MSEMLEFSSTNTIDLDAEEDAVDDGFLEIPLFDLTFDGEDATGPIDRRSGTSRRSNQASAYQSRRRSQQELTGTLAKVVQSARLDDGSIIKAGDTVELKMQQDRRSGLEVSGDFLRICKIVKDSETGLILHGYRLKRERYLLGRGSDNRGGRRNELGEFLEIHEHDNRPANVQGLVKVPISRVKFKREVTLTNKSYPMFSFRDPASNFTPRLRMSQREFNRDVFRRGPLVCRWARTSIISPNGQVYGGTFRRLTDLQCKPTTSSRLNHNESSSSLTNSTTGHARTPSLEEVSALHHEQAHVPFKKKRYKFVDIYCGAGGASKGASNAGLEVVAGLDHDKLAISAWKRNNPCALELMLDAFVLLKEGPFNILGTCDILHISNPCQPFSHSHTVAGKNDEINIKQLETIKPLLESTKARILVLENTSGLANIAENKPYFNKLLRDISTAGPCYNLHYMIVNMADYGLPQQRKRLLIIAARKGTPLPPMPQPTHGPEGSGLRPYVSIGDALELLEHLEPDFDHEYHKIHPQARHQYDPYQVFVDCITTKGVTTKHWMGEDFTPLELALLQSLPYDFELAGSWRKAIKQIGNMFPPLMAEIIYRSCAQTLEAFDAGFISAEEEIFDLNITLLEKGINNPEPPSPTSKYQYLTPITLSDAQHTVHSSAWAKRDLSGRKKETWNITYDYTRRASSTPTPDEPASVRRRTISSAMPVRKVGRPNELSLIPRPRQRPTQRFRYGMSNNNVINLIDSDSE